MNWGRRDPEVKSPQHLGLVDSVVVKVLTLVDNTVRARCKLRREDADLGFEHVEPVFKCHV